MHPRPPLKQDPQWKVLSRNDWGEILELLQKKTYQRKFQIIEAYIEIVAKEGFHEASHGAIAKKCKITRQLVDHHFPEASFLPALCYRYIYARFQKKAADGLTARVGFKGQLRGYLDSVADWVCDQRLDARFLVQFYSLLQIHPELTELQERNLRIGHERIVALCKASRGDGFFSSTSDSALALRVASFQTHILGFITMHAWKSEKSLPPLLKEEFWRSSLAILGIPENSRA